MQGIYRDEHNSHEIDLRLAVWSKGDLKDTYMSIGNELSDADWIFEENEAFVLIEFKYWKHGKLELPKIEFYAKTVKKFYGSAFFLLATKTPKPMCYIVVLASPLKDEFITKAAVASIKKRLPFELQKRQEFPRELIRCFNIYSVAEWNEQYPLYPISCLQEEETP